MGAALRLVVRCAAGHDSTSSAPAISSCVLGTRAALYCLLLFTATITVCLIAYRLMACCSCGRALASQAALRTQLAQVVLQRVLLRRRQRQLAAVVHVRLAANRCKQRLQREAAAMQLARSAEAYLLVLHECVCLLLDTQAAVILTHVDSISRR